MYGECNSQLVLSNVICKHALKNSKDNLVSNSWNLLNVFFLKSEL